MRPVRLEMTAFGPFASTEVVDFRKLGDNTFFLIHGPTGAGKTSVLDGMCYALYGEGTGTERTAAFMRSHFAPDHLATQVVFDFRIGSELYRVARRPRQERPTSTGRSGTLPAEATLWRRTGACDDASPGEVLATGVREVTGTVQDLLGFSVDQFRQVVMLPQGEFRKLLSADSKARQEILEQLFNARLYGDLELFLKGKKRSLRDEMVLLHERLAEIFGQAGVADAHELETWAELARTEMEQAEARAAQAARAADDAGAALRAGTHVCSLFQACGEAADALAQARTRLGEAETAFQAAAALLVAEREREPERQAADRALKELEAIAAKVEALREAFAAREEALLAEQAAVGRSAAAAAAEQASREAFAAAQESLGTAQEQAGRLPVVQTELAGLLAVASDLEALSRWTRRRQVRQEKADRAEAATQKARDLLEQAQAAFAHLDARWRAGQAGRLAATLVSGAPCPVCGSTEHPAPAVPAEEVPSDELLEAAQRELESRSRMLTELVHKHQRAASRLAAAVATVETLESRPSLRSQPASGEVEARVERLQAEEAELRRTLETVPALERAAEEARAAATRAAAEAAAARDDAKAAELHYSRMDGVYQERLREVPEEYRDPGDLEAAVNAARAESEALRSALTQAQEQERAASDRRIAAQTQEQNARAAAEAAAQAIEGLQMPDLTTLQATADAAAGERDRLMAASGQAKTAFEQLARGRHRAAELREQADTCEQRYNSVALLADMASGSNALGVSFQRYVLSLFLDEVLATATHRLLAMTSGRYRLHTAAGQADRRRAGGLDLEVFDEFTGDDRPVGTLSGGEGFLASLALALALAEVVQRFSGGIRLDAVFIDEGFGSLDPEALDAAIDTLLGLREHGRLVGVISHVPELQERIDCRLEVCASSAGSTTRFIVP
jgi:exonuclease SbcC